MNVPRMGYLGRRNFIFRGHVSNSSRGKGEKVSAGGSSQ